MIIKVIIIIFLDGYLLSDSGYSTNKAVSNMKDIIDSFNLKPEVELKFDINFCFFHIKQLI